MAINVDLVADASKAIKEAGKLGDALEEVADELKDVGSTGKTIDDKVGDAFRNIGADAKAAGKKIGDGVKDGTDRAGDGLDDMKSEAAGTARETAASFASIEDAGGALQEVLANSFAGFGPAGMAAGILAAAGVGMLISSATESAEKINENKEKMLDLAQTIRDNGGVLTEADYVAQMDAYGYAIQDTKEWWELFQEDAVTGWQELRDISREAGLSAKDVYRAGFGDAKAAKDTLDSVNEKIRVLKERKEAVYETTGAIMDPVDAETLASLEKARELIQTNVTAQEEAAEVEAQRKQSIEGTSEALRDEALAQEAAEQNEKDLAKYVAGTAENFRAQADAIEEATDALKNSVTTELDYLDSQAALAEKLKETDAAWDINTAKGRDNRRAVVDIAEGIEDMARASLDAGEPVAGVTKKFQEQKDALVTQVLPAFKGNKDAAQAFIDTILKTPPVVKTTVQLNKEQAEKDLKALQSPRGIPMHINVDGTAVENYFMTQQGRKVFVDFAPRGGGQAAMLP